MRIVVNDFAASEGGAISILVSLYNYIIESGDQNEWFFLLSDYYIEEKTNIHIVLCEKEKKSRIRRLLFDNFYGSKIINVLKPDCILYLQNTLVRRVKAKTIMYMDQPIPFQDTCRFSFFDKEQRPFAVYLYLIGNLVKKACKKSDYIIVQTNWIKEAIIKKCGINRDKICIVPPEIVFDINSDNGVIFDSKSFFYPASGAYYKNHRCIYNAICSLKEQGYEDFKVQLTMDGTSDLNVIYCGRLPHSEVMKKMESSTLLFPSYIETYGLPLVEARRVGTIIFASDTSFSHELLDDYDNAYFFDPFNCEQLASLMKKVLDGEIIKRETEYHQPSEVNSWKEIVEIMQRL